VLTERPKSFWKNVKQDFNEFCITCLVNQEEFQAPHPETNESVSWIIQAGKRLSGNTRDDLLQLTMDKHAEAQYKPILFLVCVPILQQLPKFDPMVVHKEIVNHW
jgi:hypothetical protein